MAYKLAASETATIGCGIRIAFLMRRVPRGDWMPGCPTMQRAEGFMSPRGFARVCFAALTGSVLVNSNILSANQYLSIFAHTLIIR